MTINEFFETNIGPSLGEHEDYAVFRTMFVMGAAYVINGIVTAESEGEIEPFLHAVQAETEMHLRDADPETIRT